MSVYIFNYKLTKLKNKSMKFRISKEELNSINDSYFDSVKNYYLIKSNQYLFKFVVIDAAGKRLTILDSEIKKLELLFEESFKDYCYLLKKASQLGKILKVDVIQLLITVENYDYNMQTCSYTNENYVYSRNTKSDLGSKFNKSISIDESNLFNLAFNEYKNRIEFPFSSKPNLKENYLNSLNNEYVNYLSDKNIGYISTGSNTSDKNYIVWYQDIDSKYALVIFFSVLIKNPQFSVSKKLIDLMIKKLKNDGISEVEYFVSSNNIKAIKTVIKNKFNLKFYVLNHYL